MSRANRFIAVLLAVVLVLATGVGALLAVSAVGDLFAGQVGALKGVGQLIAGLVLAILAGALGFTYARRAIKPHAPSAAA